MNLKKKQWLFSIRRGLNATDIAKDLKVSLSTVSRHLQKMKNDPNYFNKKTFPKNRKPCLDDRGERHLVRAALLSPFKTFTELGRSGVAGRIIVEKDCGPECLKDMELQRRSQGESQGLKRVVKLHVCSLQKLIKVGPYQSGIKCSFLMRAISTLESSQLA